MLKTSTQILSKHPTLGQPVWETHPHLLRQNEITPGISREEYDLRRFRLMQNLPEKSVVIVPGYQLRYKSNGIFYPFSQSSNLFYLSGFREPMGALALVKNSNSPRKYDSHLFVLPKDSVKEMWDGFRTGSQYAPQVFNIDKAFPVSEFHPVMANLISSALQSRAQIVSDLPILGFKRGKQVVSDPTALKDEFMTFHASPSQDLSIPSFMRKGIFGTNELALKHFSKSEIEQLESGWSHQMPLQPKLDRLRLYKSDSEFNLMRQAGKISGRAFVAAMKHSKQNIGKERVSEHQLDALIEYSAKMQGADELGYVSVVAGGGNGLILHYTSNDQLLSAGDSVLVDAGAKFGGYTADITRTWPVNGSYSHAQKLLYEAVLTVQKEAVQLCRENSKHSLNDIHNFTTTRLRQEAEKAMQISLSSSDMARYFPHHVSHYLGLDVHDTPSISRSERLTRGMVVTIEPGLYIPENEKNIPPEFRGLAVRIEDDVFVDSTNPIVLTTEAPKEVVDIEHL